jgi:hypothetical protein
VGQGDWSHGYRQLRVSIGDDAWMWVGENRVPAGFHRDGDEAVVRAEAGLRLPADPACRLTVECTTDVMEATRAALQVTGYWPA